MNCNTNPKSEIRSLIKSGTKRIQISKLKYFKQFFGLVTSLIFLSCGNYIIERAASDYFPYKDGNWWQYSGGPQYSPQTIRVEVEPKDTILGLECYPVNFSGDIHYFLKTDKAIEEYIKIDYTFSGNDYTIAEDFLKRIELPLIAGNSYQDSLDDSLNVSGSWIKVKYKVEGLVSRYESEDLYGNIYKIVLSTIETISLSDTIMTSTNYLEEYYAPDIGLIRFKNSDGEYQLIEYEVK